MKNTINYQNEPIPNATAIFNEVLSTLPELNNLKKYSFSELFSQHERGHYEKNEDIFGKEISYNTWLNEKDQEKPQNEIQGLYILYEAETPVYVGISRKLIRRLRNHFLGTSHFEASLVYLMAKEKYKDEYKAKTREDSPFEEHREEFQKDMRERWKIAIIPEQDHYKLYLREIAIACELKTKLP